MGLIVFAGHFSFMVAPERNFSPVYNAASLPADPNVIPAAGAPTVIIDPGHGGIDDGTKFFGLAEKDLTLDVGQRVEAILKSAGVDTVLTRRQDVYVSLPERVEIANKVWESNSNCIFVSIHFNQSSAEYVDGIETYYADQKIPSAADWTWIGYFDHPESRNIDRGENLAAVVQQAVDSRMLTANRGIKSRSLFVTRHTWMPAVLVEGGFISNKLENQALRNSAYRDRLAQGLASGIMSYVATMHSPAPRIASASNGADSPHH